MATNKMAGSDLFNIHLPQFEGPFDLLLFFIERDELDIYDIPIATITKDFLTYIHQLERLNIDVASEFIVVAAQLMRIKAKMLLPRKPLDEEGNEIDPRMELVDRLLEYKRYKSVLEELRALEDNQSYRQARGYANKELSELAESDLVDLELESLSLYKLMRAFQTVMRRLEQPEKETVHAIYSWPFTIADQQAMILGKLKPGKRLAFTSIFKDCQNRVHAIVTFLALLDLLNMGMASIVQGEGFNNFWLTEHIAEADETLGDSADTVENS